MVVHPEFAAQGSFAHLKLGAKPPRHDLRTLRFTDYIDEATLPAIPASYDWTQDVSSFPMYGNDKLGDCTWAGVGHLIQAWTAAAGKEVTPTLAAIEKGYWETGNPPSKHGTAGGPTDDGRNELDVLNYWRKSGLGGRAKITAYVSVNPANIAHVQAAIYLFGGVYTGISLPLTAQTQHEWDVVGDGRTANSAPGSWGGHCVPYLIYAPGTFGVVTWGSVLTLTTRFHQVYTDELYAIVSPQFLKAGRSPAGFDMAALQSDLAAL